MFKHNFFCYSIIIVNLVSITLFSCNYHPGEIPFPEKELSYSQPVTVPLQFTPEKKLTWDTARQGGIKPLIKKLDIDALPSVPYDTSGFKPFKKPAGEVKFDYNSLPDTAFSLDKLSDRSLQFKTSLLEPPAIIKTLAPTPQKGKPISIFDFGQIHGLQAKFITCLLKDKNGLMWIGSGEGLFRYDGEHIRTYISGLGGKFINGIAEDNNGKIWFAQEGQIGMIDPYNGTVSYSKKIGAIKNNLTKIFKDEKGLLWVYNNLDKAVSIIDPLAQSFKNLDRKAGLSDTQ
jgi:hypothetical protein